MKIFFKSDIYAAVETPQQNQSPTHQQLCETNDPCLHQHKLSSVPPANHVVKQNKKKTMISFFFVETDIPILISHSSCIPGGNNYGPPDSTNALCNGNSRKIKRQQTS